MIPLPDEQTCKAVEAGFLEFIKTEDLYGYGTMCWTEGQSELQIEAMCTQQW